jgi:anaerobic magnesium-protoporphyrin IX monomethyl ester cyclase
MKITFLEPPSIEDKVPERLAGCTYELYHFPDLANLYPLTMLHQAGYDVCYVDSGLEKLGEEGFMKRVEGDRSSIYVIHSVILSKRTDLHFMRKILGGKGNIRFILHGPEPTRVPEQYLIDPRVLVCRGEIENKIMECIRGEKPAGVSFSRDGEVVHVEPSLELVDLDALPIPHRFHPSIRKYALSYFNPKFRGRPYTAMMASRGCSFRCLFCVPNSISFARELEHIRYFGRKPPPSIASADRVSAEFEAIAEGGYRSVMVLDDQFLWGKRRTLEICRMIEGFSLEWGCLSRADFLTDEEVIRALAKSGCVSIDIGVESFRQKVLDYIRKDLEAGTARKAVALLKRHGIDPKLNLMFGTCPEETEEDIAYTVKEAKKLGIDNVMFSVATPFKGTEFYHFCKSRGYLTDDSDYINPLGKSVISYPGLKGRDLERLQRKAYRTFYLRPGFMLKRLRRCASWRRLKEDLRVALELFFQKR